MPQEAPRNSQEASSYVFSRVGEIPEAESYVFFAWRRGPQEVDLYVNSRVEAAPQVRGSAAKAVYMWRARLLHGFI